MATVGFIVVGVLLAAVVAWLIVLQVTKEDTRDEESPTEVEPITPVSVVLVDPSVFVDQESGNDDADVFNNRDFPFKTVEAALKFIEDQNQVETWSGTAVVKLFVGGYAIDTATEWKINLEGGFGEAVTLTTENRTLTSVTVEVQNIAPPTAKFPEAALVNDITFTSPDVPVGTFFMVFDGKRFVYQRISTTVIQVPVAIANLVAGNMVQLVEVGTIINAVDSQTDIIMSNGTMNVQDLHFVVSGVNTVAFPFATQGEQKDGLVNIKWCIFIGLDLTKAVDIETTANLSNSFFDDGVETLPTPFPTSYTGCYIARNLDAAEANINVVNTRCGIIKLEVRCVLTGDGITCDPVNNFQGIDAVQECEVKIGVAQFVNLSNTSAILALEFCNVEIDKLSISSSGNNSSLFFIDNLSTVSVFTLDATQMQTNSELCDVGGSATLKLLNTTGSSNLQSPTSIVGTVTNHVPQFTAQATTFTSAGSTLITQG